MCPFREGDESRRPTQFLRERFTGCFDRGRHARRERAPGLAGCAGGWGRAVSIWAMCGRRTSRWPGRIWPGAGLALVAAEPPAPAGT